MKKGIEQLQHKMLKNVLVIKKKNIEPFYEPV